MDAGGLVAVSTGRLGIDKLGREEEARQTLRKMVRGWADFHMDWPNGASVLVRLKHFTEPRRLPRSSPAPDRTASDSMMRTSSLLLSVPLLNLLRFFSSPLRTNRPSGGSLVPLATTDFVGFIHQDAWRELWDEQMSEYLAGDEADHVLHGLRR
jgi:hypothetical protein